MIVEILGYFFPFIISNASEFCSERFGNLVKLWKTFPFESCSSDFFALACYLFFGPFGSRNFVSVAPRNRRQRKARHRASPPFIDNSQNIRFATLSDAIQMPPITRLAKSSYFCKQELTLIRSF